jgi:predicted AAA+ superfamily ATPase
VANPDDAVEILAELSNDNLYKDIFTLRDIRRADRFERLTKALAYQVGSEVNLTELGQMTGLNRNTVDQYISLLEQAYIIFRVGSYSRNLRNELKKASKIYFYDTGLRNAIIGDFTPARTRGDIGHLFENFVIAEYAKGRVSADGETGWFWRTSAGQEVDFIRQDGSDLDAFEIKWNPKAKTKLPQTFMEAYHPAHVTVVNRDNLFEVLLPGLYA